MGMPIFTDNCKRDGKAGDWYTGNRRIRCLRYEARTPAQKALVPDVILQENNYPAGTSGYRS
jgi:hypothetical protein